jgi:SAM-dependent methyltransferase
LIPCTKTKLAESSSETHEMVAKARENARKNGFSNVEFRFGEIEALPVADESVDVIISNCVINLSPEKPRAFREAYRVLKPSGRLAVADIVATATLPDKVRGDWAAYTGCMAGASQIGDLEEMLRKAGFEKIKIAAKDTSRSFIREWLPGKRRLPGFRNNRGREAQGAHGERLTRNSHSERNAPSNRSLVIDRHADHRD